MLTGRRDNIDAPKDARAPIYAHTFLSSLACYSAFFPTRQNTAAHVEQVSKLRSYLIRVRRTLNRMKQRSPRAL